MLWRLRTTLPDRPGALAVLATKCGHASVNIVGFQAFPEIGVVTDELVLDVPDDWGRPELAALVESAGGRAVSAMPASEAALMDQPTRYVSAARAVVAQPACFPEVIAGLFDAEADPVETDALALVQDVMDLRVGDVSVQVRRTAPFTAVEQARGAALADLVADVLARASAVADPPVGLRLGPALVPTYDVLPDAVVARVDGTVVGRADLRDVDGGAREVGLVVDAAWQRRGIGTRLLVTIARVAAGAGSEEIVLTTDADNQAVLPLVLGAHLRGRIRISGDRLTVRVLVRDLQPLAV